MPLNHDLYPSEQIELRELTANKVIDSLGKVDADHDHAYMRSYVALIPATCTVDSVSRLDQAINDLTKLSSGTRRALLEAHQEDQRCLMIKTKMTIKE